MLVSFDPIAKTIIVRVNNPTTSAGKYAIVFSPNGWVDWVRYPLMVCHVE